MSLDIAVIGHPQRITMAGKLAHDLGAGLLLDVEGRGCEFMHHTALTMLYYATEAHWLVVLEDDAVPVPDFRHHLEQALDHASSLLVCLYLGTGANPIVQRAFHLAIQGADGAGAAWITADAMTAGVGYAVHRSIAERLLDATEHGTEEWPMRVTRWAQRAGMRVDYTWPSLVNHQDGWSTIAQREVFGRVAHRVGTRLHWDTGAVHMQVPQWDLESPLTQED